MCESEITLDDWLAEVNCTYTASRLSDVDNLTSVKVVCHQYVAGDVTLRDLMDGERLL